jgi:hypothetical protein
MIYEVIRVFVWILAALNQPQESRQARDTGMATKACSRLCTRPDRVQSANTAVVEVGLD